MKEVSLFDCRFCEKCNIKLLYSDRFDAHYCPNCNEWKEANCGEPNCFYCNKRPEKPLS